MPPRPLDETTSSDDTTTDDSTTETTTDSDDSTTDSDDTTETDSSEEDSAHFSPAQSGAVVKNAPHDEEFVVAGGVGKAAAPAPSAGRPAGAAAPGPVGVAVHNAPHDEEFSVAGGGKAPAPGPVGGKRGAPPGRGGVIHNDHADEFEDVEDDMSDDDLPTPQKKPLGAVAGPGTGAAAAPAGGRLVKNDQFDEEYTVAPSTTAPPPQRGVAPAPKIAATSNSMAPPSSDDEEDEDDDDTEDSEESDEGEAPSMTNINASGQSAVGGSVVASKSVEYNPEEYAHITANVPPDVRDLFTYITSYQPTTMELPAKLRPFIPDFLPSVGDIDTFCKVPRPDDKADGFGLVVVDEPSSKMSNPAIVTSWLAHHENVSTNFVEGILDSLEDAANRPQAINKWIDDLRENQAGKAPPSVYYSKPMPSIDSLLQEWPAGFEEVLNSDLQLPPPNIDLDTEQYVKMLCAILDIPVHSNLVESLHVMFTLYLEFRENQHFKAA